MSHHRPVRILSVSPHQAGRHPLSGVLQQSGFEVREATTAAEALRLALEKPDLILSELTPSDQSGLEFCYQIKASPATASIPIPPLFLGPAESGVRFRVRRRPGVAPWRLPWSRVRLSPP
jgi:CheY-like chemotaxis protein